MEKYKPTERIVVEKQISSTIIINYTSLKKKIEELERINVEFENKCDFLNKRCRKLRDEKKRLKEKLARYV